jgi:hypothetical protein
MTRLTKLLAAGTLLATISEPSPVTAITIDDFSIGAITVDGPTGTVTQNGLEGSHVVGGSREISVERVGNRAQVDAQAGQFQFSATSNDYGYFLLRYGVGEPLGRDITVGGHDRLRFRFGGGAPVIIWTYVNLPVKPSGNGLDIGSAASALGGSGVVEVPYTKYSANLAYLDSFTMYGIRQTPTTGFQLDEIVTAGPPVAGDYDRDGQVTMADYNEWRRNFGKSAPVGLILGPDGNNDGKIDASDYTIWRHSFAAPIITRAAPASTPEPAAYYLMAAAVCWTFSSLHRQLSLRDSGHKDAEAVRVSRAI